MYGGFKRQCWVLVGDFNRQCQIIVLHTGGKIDLQNKLQVTTWIFQVTLL